MSSEHCSKTVLICLNVLHDVSEQRWLRCSSLFIVLHVTIAPATFRSSCNSSQVTAGFFLTFLISNLRAYMLWNLAWHFHLHIIKPVVLTVMFKIFALNLFSIWMLFKNVVPENCRQFFCLHHDCYLLHKMFPSDVFYNATKYNLHKTIFCSIYIQNLIYFYAAFTLIHFLNHLSTAGCSWAPSWHWMSGRVNTKRQAAIHTYIQPMCNLK